MSNRLVKVPSIAIMAVASLSTLLVNKAVAQDSDPKSWLEKITETTGSTDLSSFITKLINWGIGFAAIVAVIMLIAAGFMYITANGDETKIGKATKTLTFAIVGLIVCFIAVLLVNFVLADILDAKN